MPKRRTDAEIHASINKKIQDGRSDTAHWTKNKELNALYHTALVRKVGGKPFFGHGNWYEYLEKQHGISSLTRESYYDNQIHELINKKIRDGTPTGADHWRKNKELHPLYRATFRRKVGGKSFFGHGRWKDYLQALAGIVEGFSKQK